MGSQFENWLEAVERKERGPVSMQRVPGCLACADARHVMRRYTVRPLIIPEKFEAQVPQDRTGCSIDFQL
jgi:hypothetical protein